MSKLVITRTVMQLENKPIDPAKAREGLERIKAMFTKDAA